MSELTEYKGRYSERYRGLPAEIRLQIWKLLIPREVMLNKVTMHSDKPSTTAIDEVYSKTGQGRLFARCKFDKPLGLALLALNQTIRAEVLPLFKLKIKLHHRGPPSLLERNNFIHNSPVQISRLVNDIQAGVLRERAVSAHIVGFLNHERVGIFRNLQYLSIEISLHDLDTLRRLLKTLIERIHPTSSYTTESGRRRVAELLVHAADILPDFWTMGEECEVEESIEYKKFYSFAKKIAASKRLDCEVQVFEDTDTGMYSRLYLHFSRMS